MQSGLQLDEIYDVVQEPSESVEQLDQVSISVLQGLETSLSRLKELAVVDPNLLPYLQTAIWELTKKIGDTRSMLSPEALSEYEMEQSFNTLFDISRQQAELGIEYRRAPAPSLSLELKIQRMGEDLDRVSARIGKENIQNKVYAIESEIQKTFRDIGVVKSYHNADEDMLREAADLQNTGDEVAELNRKVMALRIQREVLRVCLGRMGEA